MSKYIKASTIENRISELFKQYVPASGKADTVGGEIVRAITRIRYRWWNDGDQIGCGYGRETCNPAARFLLAKCDSIIQNDLHDMWGETYMEMPDSDYDAYLDTLESDIVRYLDEHQELFEEPNTEDMWDFSDPDEDYDDTDEWDEDEDDWEDEEDDEDWY